MAMTSTQKEVKSRAKAEKKDAGKGKSYVVAVVQSVVIFGAIVFGLGFYAGGHFADSRHQEIQSAVTTATSKH